MPTYINVVVLCAQRIPTETLVQIHIQFTLHEYVGSVRHALLCARALDGPRSPKHRECVM